MKRCMLGILILGVLLSFVGCTANVSGESEENPFAFLNGPFTLSGVLSVSDSDYGIVLTSPDGKTGKVTFQAPESMEGYVFEKANDGFYVSYGDLRVPFSANKLPGGIGRLFSLLSLDVVNLEASEVRANGIEMKVYTLALGADQTLKMYFRKSDGVPLRAEFNAHGANAIFHIQKAEY